LCVVTAPPIDVLILAGGEATRLPGKLQIAAGDVPMIVRVYRNVSGNRETVISCNATFAPEIDAALPCPMVVDRWPRRGPLAGMLSAMEAMRSHVIFVVAGDAPFVTSAFIDRLASQWRPGDEAVVPRHGGLVEPLTALYERTAFLRAGIPLLLAGIGGPRPVLAALAVNYVDIEDDERVFTNVNTLADYAAIHEVLS
jgi:molybdopterin-guanine dinucleotide biosynthesis protein A